MDERFLRINDTVSHVKVGVTSKGQVTGKLVRVGSDCPAITVLPLDVTNGVAQFHWGLTARSLAAGWYELQVFVNGCECSSIPVLVSGPCEVTSVEQVDRAPDCQDECSRCGKLPVSPDHSCGCAPAPTCETEICPPLANNEPQQYIPAYRRS